MLIVSGFPWPTHEALRAGRVYRRLSVREHAEVLSRPPGPWEVMNEADAALHNDRLMSSTVNLEWNRRGRPGPRFLGAGAPEPWVVFDLDALSVVPDGVPSDVIADVERLAIRAFCLCTQPDEWIFAWVEDSVPYRFWPRRQPVDGSGEWPVGFFPDGDDHLFIAQDFSWGVNALFFADGCEWGLTVFGQRIFDALSGHWPNAWARIVRKSASAP